MKKYTKVWFLYAMNSFQVQMNVRWVLILFLLAKILRFFIFSLFIVILVGKTKVLAGYSLNQTIFFFLSFNLIDIFTQLLFREVYRFRPAVVSGNFDFYLSKPLNPLFRALVTGPDILDFFTLIPLVLATFYYVNLMHIGSLFSLITYILMLIVGFMIALAFHILVLALAILTTEIDHAVMLYRDVIAMGRMPIDIYIEPIRSILTFIIPVGIMMTFPAKSLLGLLSPELMIYAVIFTALIFYLSLKSWEYALKRYASASS